MILFIIELMAITTMLGALIRETIRILHEEED